MQTELSTSGLPLADEITVSSEILQRPAPPPQDGSQPFGYRFRQVFEPDLEDIMPMPQYDPQRQVSFTDDVRVPIMKGTSIPGKLKYEPKWIDGSWHLDVSRDAPTPD
jgi:hypothetical protein